MNTKWTLITVTWNSATTLAHFWVTPPPAGVEWIVVDNGSTDDTAAVAHKLGASRVMALPTNLGFGAANNRALAVAKGDYVAFVNPDVTVNYEDLDSLAALLDQTGGLVSPQLVNSDGSLQANGRGMPTLWNKVRNRTKAVSGVEDNYTLYAEDGQSRHVVWVMGAVVMGSKDVFASLGGWNERYFLYYEDSDLGVRAWQQGLSVTLVGSCRWVHGWARETKNFRVVPWMREISSMSRFYSLYPEFLFFPQKIAVRHSAAFASAGRSLVKGDQS